MIRLTLVAGAAALSACAQQPGSGAGDNGAAAQADAGANSLASNTAQSAPAPPGPPAAAGLLPPDAAVADSTAGQSEVEVSFTSRLSPARLTDWYRRTARAGAFTLGSEMEEGAERVLTGRLHGTPREWTVRLAPDEAGGSAAMLLVTGR